MLLWEEKTAKPASKLDECSPLTYDGDMKNRTVPALFACILFCLTGAAAAQDAAALQQQPGYRRLDDRYRAWLDRVWHLAAAAEKKTFLDLTNDRDRDLFIRLFWKQRDPTPGTPENEFQAEVEQRFQHVEKTFRGGGKPGWATDRGRIYMILGRPNSIETVENAAGVCPTQVWYYYGDAKVGLPPYFNITFFRRNGIGDWVLYHPAADGPAELLLDTGTVDTRNNAEVYRLLKRMAPTLTGPALSMIPGQQTYGYSPSPRSNFVLSAIYESPVKRVNVQYAGDFLKYKGFVKADASTDYIENSGAVMVARHPRFTASFVHFAVKPKKVGLEYAADRGQYLVNFNVHVSVRRGDPERIVHQYSKTFSSSFDKGQLELLRAGGFVLHDQFPLIPGDYKLLVFVENTVNREFTYLEKEIHVPAAGTETRLSEPLLGYRSEGQGEEFLHAFKFGALKLFVDPDRTFPAREIPLLGFTLSDVAADEWEGGRLEWEVSGGPTRSPFRHQGSLPLDGRAAAEVHSFVFPLSPTPLPAGYYEYSLRFCTASGVVRARRGGDFTISPLPSLPRPTEIYTQLHLDNPYTVDYTLGLQYRFNGEAERAETVLRHCLELNPAFTEARLALLDTQVVLGRFEQVLGQVESLKDDAKNAFSYHYFKGAALFGLQRFREALPELLAAQAIYDGEVTLINLLGRTFRQLGDSEQARRAFTASLKLQPNQETVKKWLAELGPAAPTDKQP